MNLAALLAHITAGGTVESWATHNLWWNAADAEITRLRQTPGDAVDADLATLLRRLGVG